MAASNTADWTAHALGCRRRAIEYRRWAAECPPELAHQARHYRNLAIDQWRKARFALDRARLWRTA